MPLTSSDPNTRAPAVQRTAPVGLGIGKGKKGAAPRVASKILGRQAKGLHVVRKHVPSKKSAAAARPAAPRKRRRPGQTAVKNVKKYQNSSELLIRKLPFQRCLREVLQSINTEDGVTPRIETDGYQFMHEAAEAYLIELLKDSQTAACYRNHVTLTAWDMTFARRMRKEIED